MSAVDPAALIAEHRCTRRCSRHCHRELVWLPGPDGADALDRRAIRVGIVLAGVLRPRGDLPARPQGLTARWVVAWARQAPVTTPAATDATRTARAGVAADERHGVQLSLFSSSTTAAASPSRPRPRRTA